jgi:hypothetical protein
MTTSQPQQPQQLVSWSDTFDTKTALTSLYLWLLFGFLSTMVSCDLQKWMKSNVVFRHVIGIIAFFFLFTIIDTKTLSPIYVVWFKTFFVYFVFLLMIKSKWYFSLPVLALLIIDQSVKTQHDYIQQTDPHSPTLETMNQVRNAINVAVMALIIIGFIAYTVRQRHEFGNKFSWPVLLFHFECKED